MQARLTLAGKLAANDISPLRVRFNVPGRQSMWEVEHRPRMHRIDSEVGPPSNGTSSLRCPAPPFRLPCHTCLVLSAETPGNRVITTAPTPHFSRTFTNLPCITRTRKQASGSLCQKERHMTRCLPSLTSPELRLGHRCGRGCIGCFKCSPRRVQNAS